MTTKETGKTTTKAPAKKVAPTPAKAQAKKSAAQKVQAPTPAVEVQAPAPAVKEVKEAPAVKAPAPVKKTPAKKTAKKSQAQAKYAGQKIKFLDFKLVPITGKRGTTLQLMKDGMSVEDLRKICREHPALNGGYAIPAIEAALEAGAIKLV